MQKRLRDWDDLSRMDAVARELSARLPATAVRDLATEVVRRVAASSDGTRRRRSVPPGAIDALCDALLARTPDQAAALVDGLARRGMTEEAIHLDYLGPAAARLGKRWETGEASLTEVSIASGRIFGLVRRVRRGFPPPPTDGDRFALFAGVPGETHQLGLQIAREMFRRKGWGVRLLISCDHDEIVAAADPGAYRFVGLSASGDASGGALARLVTALRIEAPAMPILVSGQITQVSPDFVALLAPDIVAATVEEAIETAEALPARS